MDKHLMNNIFEMLNNQHLHPPDQVSFVSVSIVNPPPTRSNTINCFSGDHLWGNDWPLQINSDHPYILIFEALQPHILTTI